MIFRRDRGSRWAEAIARRAGVPLERVRCLLCGVMNSKKVCTKGISSVSRCRECGFVYTDPRLPKSEILTRYSEEYFFGEYLPALGVVDGHFDLALFDARYRELLKLISSFRPAPGTLLEVGSGSGFFLKAAERAGWQVMGVELSEAAIGFSRARLGLDVRDRREIDLASLGARFDVVVMLEVLEHLFEPQQELESVRSVLQPGGLLLITTPNFNALSRLALGNDWAVLSPEEHVYYFTEGTLTTLLRRVGFHAIRFVREFKGFGVFETMNPNYTNALESWRRTVYSRLIESFGEKLLPVVQRKGLGDSLLCVASASRYTDEARCGSSRSEGLD